MEDRLAAWLIKVESRAIGGVSRRRVWCVCSACTPVLFWFKGEADVRPLGRLPLTQATFNFDPHTKSQFLIRIDSATTHVFETEVPGERLRWLRQLQAIRRKHRGLTDSTDLGRASAALAYQAEVAADSGKQQEPTTLPAAECSTSSALDTLLSEPECDDTPEDQTSTFYVSEDGQLNRLSWLDPPPSGFGLPASLQARANDWADSMSALTSPAESPPQQQQQSTLPPAPPHRSSPLINIRMPSFKHKPCANCQELVSVVNQLKDRCHNLDDEVKAGQHVIKTMQQSILSSKQQIDALQTLSSLSDESSRVQFVLDRERQFTQLQLDNAHLQQNTQALTRRLKQLETEQQQALNDVDAYRESIKTKEQLIMQLVNANEGGGPHPAISGDEAEVALDVPNGQRMSVLLPSSGGALEATVDDLAALEQLRDLVQGFESQNLFLNQEILDLQATIGKLEEREKATERRNFDLEAEYYQLKSKYVLLLNHIQADQKSKVLNAANVSELVRLATTGRTLTPAVDETRASPSDDQQPASDVLGGPNDVYDSLGFYMTAARRSQSPAVVMLNAAAGGTGEGEGTDLVSKATQLHQKADDLRAWSKQEQKPDYIEWLQKWDSFLVNLSNRGITPSDSLKSLVRTGVPHTYRTRVWTNLINYWVRDVVDEVGRGYYESLSKRTSSDEYDAMLKQIDLDLNRTLPGNRHFEDCDSDKMASLRRVLYAFRYHNPKVGYCQGLNRLVAVALLYLAEDAAFWFVVACVDNLQPTEYYSQSLTGAIVDQKVLADLVQEKLPRVCQQLRHFDVDLSLFTLPWFITCFVDALPHKVYLKIIDCFMYEQNKVLFRFALAILKVREKELLACRTAGALHSCLSHLAHTIHDYRILAQVAFNELNPLSHRFIESRRQFYREQLTKQ